MTFRLVSAFAVLGLVAGGCGGKSITQDDNQSGAGQGGSVVTGGSGGAGAVSSGGKVSTGGAVSTGGMGTAGAGAVAGTAGYAGEACTAPPDPGPCNAYFETWYHDASTGICRPTYYGGCGGNENRYASLAECQKACFGGTPNYDSCKQASDCTLTGASCCGLCDGPNLTAHSFVAYSSPGDPACSFALDRAAPAGGSGNLGAPNPGPGACPMCPAIPPDSGTARYFVPECIAGQCAVTDVRTSAATACKTSDECRLRRGTSCCESCDGPLIAVRNDGSFEELVCTGPIPPCLACEPSEPPLGAYAACSGDGRCVIAYPAD